VRDAARQLADRFHLLRLPQRLLGQLAALGLGIKFLRPALDQNHQAEQKQCGRNSEVKMRRHGLPPGGKDRLGR
jgi:hypothetical protein